MSAVLVASCLGLTGCNAVGTAYRFADWWIEYRIETWVDLDSSQESQLQEKLDAFLVWHRSTVIPRVTALTQELVVAAEKGRFVDVVVQRESQINELFYESIEPVARAVGGVFTSLTREQIDELEDGLNQKYAEALEASNERRQERSERMLKRTESWLGSLSEAQHAILSERITSGNQRYRFECRKKRQSELLASLRAGASAEVLSAILANWWTMRECGEQADQARRTMRTRWQDRMSRLEKTLSADQRASLRSKVAEFSGKLEALLPEKLKPQ